MTETTKIMKMTDICTKKLELKHLESERIELFPLPKGDTTNSDIGAWYVIVSKEGSLPIGRIGIVHCHPEWRHTRLQIVIQDEEKRRQGYGMEALRLVEQYLFDILAYQRIAVRIAAFTEGAVQFFKKAGYKLEGVQEQGCFYNDRFYDVILLRLLRDEYFSKWYNFGEERG